MRSRSHHLLIAPTKFRDTLSSCPARAAALARQRAALSIGRNAVVVVEAVEEVKRVVVSLLPKAIFKPHITMSGWGDWLEKGKALAATIDQQINESVGVENAAAGDDAAPDVAADLNDAWNDDFDDDIILDDESPTQVPEKQPDLPVNNGWDNEEEEEVILWTICERRHPPRRNSFLLCHCRRLRMILC